MNTFVKDVVAVEDDDDDDLSSVQWIDDHTIILTKYSKSVDFLDGNSTMDQDRNTINSDYRKINDKINQVDSFVNDLIEPGFGLTLNVFNVEGKQNTIVTSFPRKFQNDFEK